MTQGSAPSVEMPRSSFGKYRLLAQIGRGGMAEAYVAVASGPAGFNKLFVVKRMLPTLSADASYRTMFLQEARLAARLNHPNVVQTYEVGDFDGSIYMAMEYLEGQPLHRVRKALLRDGRVLSQWTWARVACEMLAGLHYAHELRDFDGSTAPRRASRREPTERLHHLRRSGEGARLRNREGRARWRQDAGRRLQGKVLVHGARAIRRRRD